MLPKTLVFLGLCCAIVAGLSMVMENMERATVEQDVQTLSEDAQALSTAKAQHRLRNLAWPCAGAAMLLCGLGMFIGDARRGTRKLKMLVDPPRHIAGVMLPALLYRIIARV